MQFWVPLSGSDHQDRGVTVCRGDFIIPKPDIPGAILQIVDLSAGAKLRLVSDFCEPTPTSCQISDTTRHTDLQYHKRTPSDWFAWTQSNVDWPPSDRLFSTTNASFFTDTSGSTTKLSLPEYHNIVNGYPNSGSAQYTWGWAFFNQDDDAWDALKRALTLGNAKITPQEINILEFPMHPTDQDVGSVVFNDSWGDATVAFQPLYESGDLVNRRTFLGVSGDGSKVYILNMGSGDTVSETQDILLSFGSRTGIQLDGGASTQMYSPELGGYALPVIFREVPDVLAVYLAP